MDPKSVVVRKRRFFGKKMVWILFSVGVVLLLGMSIQLRMTWSREHVRSVTSDAEDVVAAAETGVNMITPQRNPFEPILQLFHEFSESTSQ